MGKYWIIAGDVKTVCDALPEHYFDGVISDPPYALKFMGNKWDYTLPSPECWSSVLRVVKPGAFNLSFGGPKTFHRADCNIEDAGFEIRDHLSWNYAKGMPKPATTMGKVIDAHLGKERVVIGEQVLTGNAGVSTEDKGGTYGIGVGTTTKTIAVTAAGSEEAAEWEGHGMAPAPAWEPITVSRRPLDGIYAANALRWGTGGFWLDGCRIGGDTHTINRWTDGAKPFGGGAGHPYESHQVKGNWPRNVIMDPEAGEILDEIVGNRPSRPSVTKNGGGGKMFGTAKGQGVKVNGGFRSNGLPSRFYFSAKVSANERNAGCESLAMRSASDCVGRDDGSVGIGNGAAGAGRTGGHQNHHPCLKPIALNEYLSKLILPPPRRDGKARRLLVPFCGSGSEMIGAILAGWDEVVGIEMSEEYIEIAGLRLHHWTKDIAVAA